MIRMSVNRILPLLLLLVFFTSCTRKYKVEGSSSVTSLDGKMLFLKTLQNVKAMGFKNVKIEFEK